MNSNYYADTSYGVSTTSGLTGAIAAMGLFFWILSMALSILKIVSLWKIFKKAGKPGWASIVPIYNIYIMCEIAEKEWWYILLLCVPFVNIYAMIVLYNGMAKKFGKGGGFVVGMILLPVVFFPMLAFGKNMAIVSNQPNISNENNMADNTLGANAAAVPNMNGQTMTSNEMVTPNNPVMSEPVMPQSNDNVTSPMFNNVAQDNVQMPVTPNILDAAQNVNVEQNIGQSLENVQNNTVMSEPVMPQSNDNVVAPTFNNVAQDNVQMPVTPNTLDAAQNVNVSQNIGSSLESVQNNTVMNEPVMPQPNNNVAPSFDNANNNANQSVNEEISSNTENAMNTDFSTQEEMLDINDESDAALENNINTSKHTSLWSNNNQNNGQM